jgi:uncharacterized membrane protein YqaE (UPF0057 family)
MEENLLDRKNAVKFVVNTLEKNNKVNVLKWISKQENNWNRPVALLLCFGMPPWTMVMMTGSLFNIHSILSCFLILLLWFPGVIYALVYYFINYKYWPYWM